MSHRSDASRQSPINKSIRHTSVSRSPRRHMRGSGRGSASKSPTHVSSEGSTRQAERWFEGSSLKKESGTILAEQDSLQLDGSPRHTHHSARAKNSVLADKDKPSVKKKAHIFFTVCLGLAAFLFVRSFQTPFAFVPDSEKSAKFARDLKNVPSRRLSSSEISFYEANRYVVVRNVIPPILALQLAEEAKQAKTPWFWRLHFSNAQISLASFQNWRSNPVIREFIFNHPLLPAISQLMEDKGEVRLLADHIAGVDNDVRGFRWHSDLASFGIVHPNTETCQLASTWCPIWDDANQELNDDTGGLIAMQNIKTLNSSCILTRQRAEIYSNNCESEYEANKVTFSMRLGDCMLFTEDALHSTVPLDRTKTSITTRFAFIQRFIRSDVLPAQVNAAPLCLPHAACRPIDRLTNSSIQLINECYPQVFPNVLEDEAARFERSVFDFRKQFYALWRVSGWKMLLGLVSDLGVH